MSNLKDLLVIKDKDKILEYINIMKNKYETQLKVKDVYEDMEFIIPNYDVLVKLIGIEDDKEPIESISYADQINNKLNNIDVYSTNINELYFIRMEQYALADEDAIIGRLIFTSNTKKATGNCDLILKKRNIVMEARKYNKIN